jgi:hypothetical protein
MIKRLLTALVLVVIGGTVWAAEVEWVNDLNLAVEKAQKENKKLLIDFFSPT